MVSVLIIGTTKNEGFEKLVAKFKQNDYSVVIFDPATDDFSQLNQDFDGLIDFTGNATSVVTTVLKRNRPITHIAFINKSWKISHYNGLDYTVQQKIDDLFLKTLLPECRSEVAYDNIDLLEQLVKENPKMPNVWYDLGVAYCRRGKLKEAYDAFRNVLEYDDQHCDALCQIFELVRIDPSLIGKAANFLERLKYLLKSDEAKIILKLEKLASLNKVRPEPYIFLGEIALEKKNKVKAYDAYKEAIRRLGSPDLADLLQKSGISKEDMRIAAFNYQLLSARTRQFYPKRWSIYNVMLKPFTKSERDKAVIENLLISEAAKFQDKLKLMNGRLINLPSNSVLLEKPGEDMIIERLPRLSSNTAYDYLLNFSQENRYKALLLLVEAASVLDHFFTQAVRQSSDLSMHIKKDRSNFFTERMIEKFFKPFNQMVASTLTDEQRKKLADEEELKRKLKTIDDLFVQEVPEWLVNLRLDHCPHNYLISYPGVPSSIDEFIEKCKIDRVDFENNYECYGVWDVLNLIEYPGCEASQSDVFRLALQYMVNRLNAWIGKPLELLDRKQDSSVQKQDRGISKYALVDKYFIENTNGKYDIRKARCQYLWLRFLRHLELAGLALRREKEVVEFKEKYISGQPLKGEVFDWFAEDLPSKEKYASMIFAKSEEFIKHIKSDRMFHLKRAMHSLKELATTRYASENARITYAIMAPYFEAVLLTGSNRESINGPSSS